MKKTLIILQVLLGLLSVFILFQGGRIDAVEVFFNQHNIIFYILILLQVIILCGGIKYRYGYIAFIIGVLGILSTIVTFYITGLTFVIGA